MEALPLSYQRSGARQLNNVGVSGPTSSSLSVLPTSPEETYPKPADSQQVSVERELGITSLVHVPRVPANSGVDHLFSSSSGFSCELHYSSVSSHEKHTRNTSFISHSSISGAALPVPQSSTSSHYTKESCSSWCPEPLPGYVDFAVNTPLQSSQMENSSCNGVMASEEFSKRNDWHEWADQLIDVDPLGCSWNEIFLTPVCLKWNRRWHIRF